MERLTTADRTAIAAGTIVRLADEREPHAILRKAVDGLRAELGATWSAVSTTGDGELGGILDVHGAADASVRLASLTFPEDAPAEPTAVAAAGEAAALCLWLQQHTRVALLFGPAPSESERWLEVLRAVGPHLHARLHEALELKRALLANQALERRISDLSLLFKGLDVTLSSVELRKVLRAFLTCVTSGDAIGFNRAFLLMIDEEAQELRGTVAVGPASGEEAYSIWDRIQKERTTLEQVLRAAIEDPDVEPRAGSLAERVRRFALPLDPQLSILVRAATSSASYNIYDYRSGTAREPFADAFGAAEFVVIPIQGRERTLGVIVADNLYSGRAIEKDSVYLLSGLANHVGVVIENALMFEDISRRYAELHEVQVINRALLSSADYGEVLHQIAATVASRLQAAGALLFIAEGRSAEPRLELQYSAGGPALAEDAVRRCTAIARQTLERRAGILLREVGAEEAAATGAVASLMSAPMQIDPSTVGVLVVYRSPDTPTQHTVPFDRSTQRFLSILADQAAIAVLSGRRLRTIREDQRQIHQLNELLYRNEKLAALGEVSSKIAHEIRNPLTALGGFARRVLKSSGVTGGDREAVEIIVRETARLERILNDQLAFVRSARLQLAPASLNPLVRECQLLLRQQIEVRKVHLELDLARDLPAVPVDGDRIRQVLVNLLMNALEAVGTRGTIRIATRAGEGSVDLEVANTGPPIAAEIAASLFMPFTTTKHEGTGLGMAVVNQIVLEHEGSIGVASRPPWGSVFTIRLPRPAGPVETSPA